MTVEQRITRALSTLQELDGAMKAQTYDGIQIARGKAKSSPPPGTDFGGTRGNAPPLSISSHRHFAWQFEHTTDEVKRAALLVVVECFIKEIEHPSTYKGYQGGEEHELGSDLAERILGSYEGYPSDLVDILEDLPAGYTRSVRDSNACDVMGMPKGVPDWKLREFAECVEAGITREAIKTNFQISEGTYWNKMRTCRERGMLK